jgi:two-component system sensor histidine kinase ChvG
VLAVNMLALAILVGGVLYLDQFRASLIAARLEALMVQGQIIGGAIGTSATTGEFSTDIDVDLARQILRRLVAPTGTRARLFGDDGRLIVDTRRLATGGQVLSFELPPLEGESRLRALLEFLYDAIVPLLPRLNPRPIYAERQIDVLGNFPEAERAMRGVPSQMERVAPDGTPVLTVAVPVQRLRKVLGVLLLSVEAEDVDEIVRNERLAIVEVFGVAIAATTLLSLYLAGTIARPIRRLAGAAERVRLGRGRRVPLPDFSRREDEIGDLGRSLSDMTDALYGRIDAIESFAADVAHELKNPLSSIRSAIESLERTDDARLRARLMAIVNEDVRRLDRLISDISDASRLDAELSRAEAAPVDIGRMLTSLAETYEATSRGGDRRIEVDLDAGGSLVVQGFEGRLGQVFRNLIDNALSFSPPGGAIRLVARREAGRVRVGVEDEGPGLPEGAAERVFERFYSERPEHEAFGTHSGLGLSIARQIVEAHGGHISAANRLAPDGRVAGARFLVELPA